MQRNKIAPGVFLTTVVTQKFKSSCFSVNLLQPLSRTDASLNAMLPYILRRGTREYPDMEAYAAALDGMYGAKIAAAVRRKGETQCLGLLADFVDGRYTGEAQFESVASLLINTLLDPVIENKLFKADYFQSEKNNLIERIRAQMNEKGAYALRRATELMCAREAYGTDRLGCEEAAAVITPEKLYCAWRNLLETSTLEIYYCGSLEREYVESFLHKALFALPRTVTAVLSTEVIRAAKKPRVHREHMDVTQGKLVLGLRTGRSVLDSDFPAVQMLSMVFGGSLTSKLFLTVREKLSLCYYAQSRIDKLKGVMFVQSGIDFAQYERAYDEILRQLELCRKEEITGHELSSSFQTVSALYRAVADSPSEMEDFSLGQAVAGVDYSPDDFVDMCAGVTVEQTAEAARNITLDTTYFLCGNDREVCP
jgi:predicted Zn-dependent peptidase